MNVGQLIVRPFGKGYAVFRDEERVTRQYSCAYTATGAATRLEKQARQTLRPCLKCGTKFRSTGAHHRMCNLCRSDPYRDTASWW